MVFLKKIWAKYPLAVIMFVVLLAFTIGLYFMRKQALQAAINQLNVTNPDDMKLSYLGRTDLPRGIRNNNPGNLTRTSISWQGEVANNTDGRFEQFTQFVWGVRAMIRDISGDIKKDGDNTIRKLITKYAPSNENNTAGYISSLSTRTGYGADQILDADDKAVMARLVQQICIIENGNPQSRIGKNEWISDSMFNAAWKLHKA